MDKLYKLISILFVLSLLALPLAGCTDGASVLVLKVDTPKDGTTVNKSTITVSGRLAGTQTSGAKVNVNGADVPVKDDKYSTDVTLNEGKNVINIEATNGSFKLNEQVTATYVPVKP